MLSYSVLLLGLPCADVLLLELHVSFNLALTVLATANKAVIPGGYNVSQIKLQHTIERGKISTLLLICLNYLRQEVTCMFSPAFVCLFVCVAWISQKVLQ